MTSFSVGLLSPKIKSPFWCLVMRLLCVISLFYFADAENMSKFAREEQQIREENLRLQRKLQMEVERREQLCRHLSESESSLEMEDER